MLWEDDVEIYNILMDSEEEGYIKFLEGIVNMEDFYEILSLEVIDCYKKANYEFYKYNSSIDKLNRIKISDIMLLLDDFFKSLGKRYHDYFVTKYKDLEILLGNGMNEDDYFCGLTLQFDSLGKSYIIVDNVNIDSNIFFASVLSHEFGHAVEMNLNFVSNNRMANKLAYNTCFYEVSSSFFEYAFLEYLKENRIYLNSTNICLDVYYKNMFSNFAKMLAITKIQNISLLDGNFALEDTKAIQILEDIKEKFNYYSLAKKGDNISYVNTFIYGLGSLASIYMYDYFLKDKEAFMHEFDKVLSIYQYTNDIDSFSNVGVSKSKLMDKKILVRTLENYSKDLKGDGKDERN